MLALFVSGPHYGATLLRVYAQREDRRRYALFAVYFTIFLVVLFVVALYDIVLGSWLRTFYASWSPWHFAGQNYGAAIGDIYDQSGDREAALAAYREALLLDPEHARARARSAALATGS